MRTVRPRFLRSLQSVGALIGELLIQAFAYALISLLWVAPVCLLVGVGRQFRRKVRQYRDASSYHGRSVDPQDSTELTPKEHMRHRLPSSHRPTPNE